MLQQEEIPLGTVPKEENLKNNVETPLGLSGVVFCKKSYFYYIFLHYIYNAVT